MCTMMPYSSITVTPSNLSSFLGTLIVSRLFQNGGICSRCLTRAADCPATHFIICVIVSMLGLLLGSC